MSGTGAPLPRTADAIVVGGGIVGVATARAFARAGIRAVLLEKGALGGAVTAASLACIGGHMMAVDEFPLLHRTIALWKGLAESVGGFEYRPGGQLRFVEREADLAVARSWIAAESAGGFQVSLLDPGGVREVEPALTGPILGATWSPDDVTVNPFLAVRALAKDGRDNGLAIHTGAAVRQLRCASGRVLGVDTEAGPVDAPVVVLASGPWAARLAATAGVTVPIRPRQAQAIATVRLPPLIRTVVGACESAGGVETGYTQIQQAMSGQVLFNTVVGGQIAPDGTQDRPATPSRRFIADSIATLVRLFPSLSGVTLLRSWARFEAVTPDDRFIVGPTPVDGLLMAAGCNGTGFCRAPLIAEILRDYVVGHPPDPLARLYSLDRFSTGQPA